MPSQQARYWILTIPHEHFLPYLPPGVGYIRGQLESGTESSFLHWQLLCHFQRKCTLSFVRSVFGPYHAEPTRSEAALHYVWKDDTAVDNTRYVFCFLALLT